MDEIKCFGCEHFRDAGSCGKVCRSETKPSIAIKDVETREQALQFWKESKVQFNQLQNFAHFEELLCEEIADAHLPFPLIVYKYQHRKYVNSELESITFYVKSNYFMMRELVTFSKNDIEFRGWMDKETIKPVVQAFVKFVERRR